MKVYKPLGSRVFIEVLAKQDKVSEGGIIVDAQLIKEFRGIVKKAGSKCVDVKEGDEIVFEDGAAVPISALTPTFVWMEEDQIVAIVTEEPDVEVKE